MINQIESQSELDQALQDNELVVLKFFTERCPPCKAIAPIFEDLSTRFPSILFLQCNLEKTVIDSQVVVWGVPSFVFFQRGIVTEKLTGADLGRLEGFLMEYRDGKQPSDGWISYYWRRYGF
jgi:thioredoxin 1